MKKFLSIILLIALIAYAAFKGVIWYRTSQLLSQSQATIQDNGVLQWDSIGSSVAGQVSVYDLSYQHFSLTQPVKVRRATFATGSPSSLLDSLTGNTFPHQWQVMVDGMTVMLEKRLTRDWVENGNMAASAEWLTMPCGNGALNLEDLVGMGVENLAADLKITQSRALDSSGGLRVEMDGGKLGSLELNLPGLVIASLAPPGDQLKDYGGPVALVLRDGGFMRRLAAYCARQSDQEVDVWAATAVQSMARKLQQRGYRMSQQLQALYKVWVRDGGELQLSLSAGEPLLGLPVKSELGRSSVPVDGLEQFEVFYNGARVPDVFLSALPADEPADDAPASELSPEPEPDASAIYRSGRMDDAARWLGRDVRVTLLNDRVVEGRLSDVNGRQLEVTRTVDGGELAYPLARKAIRKFEVWRRASDRGREPEAEPPEPPGDQVKSIQGNDEPARETSETE